MKDKILSAAVVFGVSLVLASLIAALGFWFAMDRAAGRFERAVREHAAAVERGGERVGIPLGRAVDGLTENVKGHASSVDRAGERIAQPLIRMEGPIDVKQPVVIEGPREGGALPVNARVGK